MQTSTPRKHYASAHLHGDLGATMVIGIDASLVDSHSDKKHAAGTFKGSAEWICKVLHKHAQSSKWPT